MKLILRPIAFDLETAQGKIMATATRLPDNRWAFQDRSYGKWLEESTRKLEPGELLQEYEAIKKRRNAERRRL